jgi:hypothetical protein
MSFATVLQCVFLKYEFPGTDNLASYLGFVLVGLPKETDAESTYSGYKCKDLFRHSGES